MLALLKCPGVMETFLQLPGYSNYLEAAFATKQPNPTDLASLIPVVWWNNTEEEVESIICRLLTFLRFVLKIKWIIL
jgi:hypothetical protein